MDIYVNVVNQKLHITTNLKSLVAGTQKFIRFIFNLADDWDDLHPFAQFSQNGTAYNVFLSTDTDGVENTVYLPHEIVEGTCNLMLYGAAGEVIGTTNCITLTIDKNNLIADASSVVLTESLYQQLVDQVTGYIGSFDDDITTINNNIDTIEDDIGTINNNIDTIEDDIGTINNTISGIEDGIGTINNNIDTIEDDIGTLSSLTTDAQTDLVAAINEVDSHANVAQAAINAMGNIIGLSYEVVSTWNDTQSDS